MKKMFQGILNTERIAGIKDVLFLDDVSIASLLDLNFSNNIVEISIKSLQNCDEGHETILTFFGQLYAEYFEVETHYGLIEVYEEITIDEMDILKFLRKFEGKKVLIEVNNENEQERIRHYNEVLKHCRSSLDLIDKYAEEFGYSREEFLIILEDEEDDL